MTTYLSRVAQREYLKDVHGIALGKSGFGEYGERRYRSKNT